MAVQRLRGMFAKNTKRAARSAPVDQKNVESAAAPLQAAFSQPAKNNFRAARDILQTAYDNYRQFDQQLDGNRGAWGFSHNTWNGLRANTELKSNQIRGQGTAGALESLSWGVNASHTVTGPGGGAGIDLRHFSSAGMGAARMDLEVKHANSWASVKAAINSAIHAHGRNQTIKIYVTNAGQIPDIGENWVDHGVARRIYSHHSVEEENMATVKFYTDTDGIFRRERRVGWP